MRFTSRTLDETGPPISAVAELRQSRARGLRLIDLSQGVPSYPTAPAIVQRVAAAARDPDVSRYAARAGLPALRASFARELSAAYRAPLDASQVLVTAGCNQAFCLTVSALATPDDEVVLPVPYYFNHHSWLRLNSVVPVYLRVGPDFVPSAAAAEALVTDRTRVIVLVTPGNPTGVTIPDAVIQEFAELAAGHDVALVVDETYRCFRRSDAPAHRLFARGDWPDHVVCLYSFSKEYAIPGYRVGAVVGHPDLLHEISKLLDCVAVCAPRIGQEAALAGVVECRRWRAERARDIARTQDRFRAVMADAPGGFELCASGAFYGWVRHPFDGEPADDVVRRLIHEQSVMVLPGTAFMPTDERYLRFSVGTLQDGDVDELRRRLLAVGRPAAASVTP